MHACVHPQHYTFRTARIRKYSVNTWEFKTFISVIKCGALIKHHGIRCVVLFFVVLSSSGVCARSRRASPLCLDDSRRASSSSLVVFCSLFSFPLLLHKHIASLFTMFILYTLRGRIENTHHSNNGGGAVLYVNNGLSPPTLLAIHNGRRDSIRPMCCLLMTFFRDPPQLSACGIVWITCSVITFLPSINTKSTQRYLTTGGAANMLITT